MSLSIHERAAEKLPLSVSHASPNLQEIISPFLARDILNEGTLVWEYESTLDQQLFLKLRSRLIVALGPGTLPYHNLTHAVTVEERTMRLCQEAGVEERVTYLMRLAALAHDLFHSGNPYRQLTNPREYPDLSNEEYAVVKVDELLKDSLELYERVRLQSLILATSFGQSDVSAVPRSELFREYRPHYYLEKILAFADVNFLESALDELLRGSLAVGEENGIALKLNEEVRDILIGFQSHIGSCLEDLETILPSKSYERYRRLHCNRASQIESLDKAGSAEYELCLKIFQGS